MRDPADADGDDAPDGTGVGPAKPESGHAGGLAGRAPPGAPAEGEDRRDDVIVLPPPKGDDPTWRAPRNLLTWLWIPVVLLAAFGLYEVAQRGWLDPNGESSAARSEATELQAAAAERSEAARRFRQVADSLESAVEGYDVRRSDFEQNRIGCAALASGYRQVDRHLVSLSVLLMERGDRLDADARSRYRELTGEVDELNRHFDASGCRTAG